MKHTKLVAAAAIVAMGGAVALQTAQGRTGNFQYPEDVWNVTSAISDDAVVNSLCSQVSVEELSKLGCPQ